MTSIAKNSAPQATNQDSLSPTCKQAEPASEPERTNQLVLKVSRGLTQEGGSQCGEDIQLRLSDGPTLVERDKTCDTPDKRSTAKEWNNRGSPTYLRCALDQILDAEAPAYLRGHNDMIASREFKDFVDSIDGQRRLAELSELWRTDPRRKDSLSIAESVAFYSGGKCSEDPRYIRHRSSNIEHELNGTKFLEGLKQEDGPVHALLRAAREEFPRLGLINPHVRFTPYPGASQFHFQTAGEDLISHVKPHEFFRELVTYLESPEGIGRVRYFADNYSSKEGPLIVSNDHELGYVPQSDTKTLLAKHWENRRITIAAVEELRVEILNAKLSAILRDHVYVSEIKLPEQKTSILLSFRDVAGRLVHLGLSMSDSEAERFKFLLFSDHSGKENPVIAALNSAGVLANCKLPANPNLVRNYSSESPRQEHERAQADAKAAAAQARRERPLWRKLSDFLGFSTESVGRK